jgi:hypothetical protein
MLCAITCTFSAPLLAAKSTRKSVIARSLASSAGYAYGIIARRPAEEGGRSRYAQVIANLCGADCSVLETGVVTVQEEQRVRSTARIARSLHRRLDFDTECFPLAQLHPL